mgnify:CR=1 FL=1
MSPPLQPINTVLTRVIHMCDFKDSGDDDIHDRDDDIANGDEDMDDDDDDDVVNDETGMGGAADDDDIDDDTHTSIRNSHRE